MRESSFERLNQSVLTAYNISAESCFNRLETTKNGLSEKEVAERQIQFGNNLLVEEAPPTLMQKFLEQFKDLMIVILITAAIVAGLFGEISDAIIILTIVILNAVIGVAQESKAEKAMAALKQLSQPFAKVKRNGQVITVSAETIVPGDVLILEAGDSVTADLRLFEVYQLRIEESALTGESVAVEKQTQLLKEENVALGDQINMAFMGSYVVYGRGEGIVVATGMQTEVGKIATLIQNQAEEPTPLQKSIQSASKWITIGIILIAMVTFGVGFVSGHEWIDMLLMSISLAVAAIPEGLPAIITIVLAIGVTRMAKERAIVKKLSAVEALGATEVICSDKTGTLTLNKMTVEEVYSPGDDSDKVFLAQMVALCNDAKETETKEGFVVLGEPTESALLVYAHRLNQSKTFLDKQFPRLHELPFDSDRKRMSVVCTTRGIQTVIVKGAPEVILKRCSQIRIGNGSFSLSEAHVQDIEAQHKTMTSKALRVLAVAVKPLSLNYESYSSEALESELTFVGLVAMMDPPRPEVAAAIETCKKAGIRTVMITGDHKDTAAAIAKSIGIVTDSDEVVTGAELDSLSEEALMDILDRVRVFARVSPEHKLRIVKALKRQGKIVAMTGDGVNDAPALKVADIGVGMGITGTDVSKSVSKIVLQDDNFATIVTAVEQGRKIYGNITKAIQYLLSCNIGEVLTVFVATLLGWTALFPVQILWVNLVTDSLPALALGVDETNSSLMKQLPRDSRKSIFSGLVGASILYQGILEGGLVLGLFAYSRVQFGPEIASTMAFAALGLIQLCHAFNVRSNKESILKLGLMNNSLLLGAVAIAGVVQVIPIVVAPLNAMFRVVPLSIQQWGIVIFAAINIVIWVEFVKLIIRRLNR